MIFDEEVNIHVNLNVKFKTTLKGNLFFLSPSTSLFLIMSNIDLKQTGSPASLSLPLFLSLFQSNLH